MSSDLIGSRHYFLLSIQASGDFLLCCEPGEHLAELCVVRAARAAPCLPRILPACKGELRALGNKALET